MRIHKHFVSQQLSSCALGKLWHEGQAWSSRASHLRTVHYRDNGKENGNYYNGIYRGYIRLYWDTVIVKDLWVLRSHRSS